MVEAHPISLIGRSVAIRAVEEELQYAARSDAKVLITGESGVGNGAVGLIAATNRTFLERIAPGVFREDLYSRLNVIHLTIPPLRERREDIPLLLKHFLERMSERYHAEPPAVTAEVNSRLMAYDWPGNVRELKNVVERLLVRGRLGVIDVADLPDDVVKRLKATAAPGPAVRTEISTML